MSAKSPVRRRDVTPVLLFPELVAQGGGLARAVQERASLYARHYEHVVILTTSFSPKIDAVVAELKQRGTLDERVVVRNFFLHSRWAAALGVPSAAAKRTADSAEIVSRRQRIPGAEFFRVADLRPGERFPFRYRYVDPAGDLMLTTHTAPGQKHEVRATLPGPEPTTLDWGATVVAPWVDDELAGLANPVLFSLQRGLNDPVLLASTKATRKVASLHNCHYVDPDDKTSGVRTNFRPLFARRGEVDTIVCLTEQQRLELTHDAPGAILRAIPYPGRPPRVAPQEKEPLLVVLVAQLIERKRVDHAIRAFSQVIRSVPDARLEIYGEGPEAARLQQLIDELRLAHAVSLMGYSLEVATAQARATCTLMTSTYEGFARVISESLSLGTAVVAYDVRYGPADLIRDGVDGVLVRRHEPAALAEAIVGLLTDPSRARAMGERGRDVVDRFPIESWEQAWLKVLSSRPSAAERALASWRRIGIARRARRRVGRLVRPRRPAPSPG